MPASTAGELTKPATVTFVVPDTVPARANLVVVWQDDRGGWQWLPAQRNRPQGTVTARTAHFSFGFLASIDVTSWARGAAGNLVNYVIGRAGLANPSCGDEKAARAAGVTVASDGGDGVKWCFGLMAGQQVLKVANNTRTFQQVTYPAGWQVVDGASVTFSVATLVRNLGHLGALPPRGYAARIVDGGGTMTLAVPVGTSGNVRVEASMLTWALSGIVFGAHVWAGVANAANSALGTAATGAADRLAAFLGGDTAATPAMHALTECLQGISDSTESLDAPTGAAVFTTVVACVPALMASQVHDAPVFALGVLVKIVNTAVTLVLTAVSLLVSGLREIWDDFASFGGRSDQIYDIHVMNPAVLAPGKVGPLRLPQSFSEAVATGWVVAAPGRECLEYTTRADLPDDLWIASYKPGILTSVVIKGRWPRTRGGLGVGSTIAELRAAFGSELVDLGEDPEGFHTYALFSDGGELAFELLGERVDFVEASGGTRIRPWPRFVEGC